MPQIAQRDVDELVGSPKRMFSVADFKTWFLVTAMLILNSLIEAVAASLDASAEGLSADAHIAAPIVVSLLYGASRWIRDTSKGLSR